MLNCEYCDYLKAANDKLKGIGEEQCLYCSFSGYIFSAEELNKDIEYPCKDLSYAEYLNRKRSSQTAKIKDGNWKVHYTKRKLLPDKKKYPMAV